MSGQDQKPVEPLWNAQQQTPSSYIPVGSRSQPPNTLSYPSFYNTRESGQQGVHTLPNIHDVYGNLGQPSPTHTGSQSHSASGNEIDFTRKDTGSSADSLSSLQHRDSVVMASGSSQHPLPSGYDESEDADDDDEISDEIDEGKEGDEKQMTAAEIRQQKRKMKRFRLTHSQTRFLMSEFARQAHPDAAHRERLSREIPGLSPRQVQVWFQNRRAKLKRLSAEDRERMMRSRAIPENYGMGLPMNQPYVPSPSTAGSTTPGLPQNSGMSRIGDMRPLSLDTLRRGNEHSYTSPTSVTPGLGSLAFTPPQSASDVQSPISTSNEMGFGYGHRALMEQRRPLLPPSHSSAPSFSSTYGASIGRIPSYERLRTSSGDSLGSPLRTSMSYSNFQNTSPQAQQGQENREHAQQSGGQQGAHSRGNSQREMPPPSAPFGLGFSFENMPNYQSSVQSQSQAPTTSGQSQPAYRGIAPPANSQGSYPSYFDYQNSNYSTPQLPQYQQPSYGGSYSSPLSSNPFGQSPMQQHQPYGQQQQQPHQPERVKEEHETHHQGGVSIGNPY
ncbi:putative homeobox transcription factor phx1 [Elsinoe fawcettii]|nr:putative homeobox transcription factor phx1 [Elsinoe fawcettii]